MSNYDRTARFYDVDMARNMEFDDVALYVAEARRRRGTTLELGCGNGRILLALAAAGAQAVGIDRSANMLAALREKATARALPSPLVCRMDVRALAFRPAFTTILCPYSLVTYLTSDDELRCMLAGVRAALTSGGRFMIDAFVPRAVAANPQFTLDYRRPFDAGELLRWKRITRVSDSINRIERRYQVCAATGCITETIDVVEDIRPMAPHILRQGLAANGFAIEQEWWDYGAGRADGAQFFTVRARPA